MKSAIQWFEAACTYGGEDSSYYTMAEMYRDIGQFNRDITLNVQEASDKGTYLPYWENITKLVATVSESQDENEIVNLEVYKLAMNAVETYARKFRRRDGRQYTERIFPAAGTQKSNGSMPYVLGLFPCIVQGKEPAGDPEAR